MAENAFWWPVAIILAGAAATYVWRGLGVALSGRIDPDGRAFEWAACIAYALVAALVARMIVLPSGPLAETPLADRLGAAALSLAVYFLAGRNMLWGVGAGIGALTLVTWGRAGMF
jgi:branched-subunit amino acid transport protein